MTTRQELAKAQRVFIVFAGLLFGGLLMVGFLVTPTLFSVLDDKQVAGMIAGEIFKNTSFFSLIVNIFLLIYANLLVKRGYFQLKLMRWFLLLAVALTLVGTFIIQPMMEEWREIALNEGAPVMQSPYAAKFGLFHHISSVMFTFEVFISFWVFWVSTRLKKSYPN